MKQEKSIITYRKNGEEITRIINKRNLSKIQKEIFEKGFFDESKMVLCSNIEYLYFQNIIFPFKTDIDFLLNENQILILENCTFDGDSIRLHGGNVQIINPISQKQHYLIKASDGNVLDVTLGSNSNLNTNFSFRTKTNHFSLNAHFTPINKMKIEAENIQLEGLKKVEELCLDAEEEIIFRKNNFISLSDYWDCYLNAEKIDLGDVEITNSDYSHLTININAPYITGRNFKLTSIGNIQINHNIYSPGKNCKYVLLNQQDFYERMSRTESGRRLTSCLKTIHNEVENRYKKRAEHAKRKVLKKLNNNPIGSENFHKNEKE